jgi:hypothetical protein
LSGLSTLSCRGCRAGQGRGTTLLRKGSEYANHKRDGNSGDRRGNLKTSFHESSFFAGIIHVAGAETAERILYDSTALPIPEAYSRLGSGFGYLFLSQTSFELENSP